MTIWKNCLEILREKLSPQTFDVFIRPIQPRISDSNLMLLVPNDHSLAEIRQKNYLGCLQNLLGEQGYKMILQVGSLKDEKSQSKQAGQSAPPGQSRLDPQYTFENFIQGPSNAIARAASQQVAERPGRSYNPLLICGGVGLGKTHLMQAVGHALRERNSNICYINAERFVGEMVQALRNHRMDQFKRKYRSVDALLMDDIQFLAGKEYSQEEFFHTFNSLLEAKRQIVATCDRLPGEVYNLEERLVSRLGWGLSVVIEPPALETRVAILMSKAKREGLDIADAVGFFVAKHFQSNIRELEGALNRLKAYSGFTGRSIDMEMCREALGDLLKVKEKQMSIENIKSTCAEYFKIRIADLVSKSRRQSITRPRQIAMALSKELTTHSLPEIGDAFGGRDHTTVLHACRRIKKLQEQDSRVDDDYRSLQKILSR